MSSLKALSLPGGYIGLLQTNTYLQSFHEYTNFNALQRVYVFHALSPAEIVSLNEFTIAVIL